MVNILDKIGHVEIDEYINFLTSSITLMRQKNIPPVKSFHEDFFKIVKKIIPKVDNQ